MSNHNAADRFQTLIESIDDWLWEIDRNGIYTYASPQVFDILGYTPEEVIGHTPLEFMTPDEANKLKPLFNKLPNNHDPIRLVNTNHLHKDGRVVIIETSAKPIFDNSGNFVCMRGLDRDVTENQNNQELKNTLLSAVDQMAEAAVFVDKELHITYINQAFSDFFGYESQEVLGKPLSILNPENYLEITTDQVINSLQTEGVWVGEVLRTRADGQSIPVLLHATTIYGDDGIIGYTGTYLDLREIQTTRQKLHDAHTNIISALSLTIEKRDPYTSGHQNNVAVLSKKIAEKLGESTDFIEGLILGASIHDIGKIHIPSELLTYPGKLTSIEFELIKTHSLAGYEILKNVEFPWPVKKMVLQHHEKLDGSGYPNGIRGDEIIREAKIIAVSDVVDAVTSHRPYRPARPVDMALSIIEEGKGSLYDPDAVDALIDIIENEHYEIH